MKARARGDRCVASQLKLTHAARAAAKQLNKAPFQAPLVAARGAREGLSALVRATQRALESG